MRPSPASRPPPSPAHGDVAVTSQWPETQRHRRPRRGGATASRDARLGASGAREHGQPVGGGAAGVWPPERHRGRRNSAADSAHGGVDPGEVAAFRHARAGEEKEGATAEFGGAWIWTGRAGAGRARVGGAAGDLRVAGERKGRGVVPVVLQKNLVFLRNRKQVPRSVKLWTAGSICAFWRGFSVKPSRTRPRAVGSSTDGSDRSYCSYCSATVNTVHSYSRRSLTAREMVRLLYS